MMTRGDLQRQFKDLIESHVEELDSDEELYNKMECLMSDGDYIKAKNKDDDETIEYVNKVNYLIDTLMVSYDTSRLYNEDVTQEDY